MELSLLYMLLIQITCHFRHLYVSNILKHTIVVLEIKKITVLSHVKVNAKYMKCSHLLLSQIEYLFFYSFMHIIMTLLVVLASNKTFNLKSQPFLTSIVNFTACSFFLPRKLMWTHSVTTLRWTMNLEICGWAATQMVSNLHLMIRMIYLVLRCVNGLSP